MSIGCSTKLITVSEFIITKMLIIATFKNTQLHRQAFSISSQILTVHTCLLKPQKCTHRFHTWGRKGDRYSENTEQRSSDTEQKG